MELDLATRCRCCLSRLTEGLVRDFHATYVWLDHKEVYSDMLLKCFNIVLSEAEGTFVCESCVWQLRAAARFRHQVLRTERKLQSYAGGESSNDSLVIMKSELGASDDEDNYILSDAVSASTPLKAVKKREREVKEVLLRRKRQLESEGRSQNIRTLVKRLVTSINSSHPLKSPLKKKDPPKRKVPTKDPLNIKWNPNTKKDNVKHKANLDTIMKYSNAVPFKKKTLSGYHCGYCDTPFPDPADLRAHTETNHEKERLTFKDKISKDITQYNVKLDVSNLICSLCNEQMGNLTILKQHLLRVHGKTTHSDIKDHLLEFKLKKGEVYDCALCPSTYETFKMLKQHMNKHYANYSCSKCENTYPTWRSMRRHNATHQQGSFKCQYCEKVFPTKDRCQRHEKVNHTSTGIVSNCPHCDETFRSYYQRNQHLVKVHNADSPYKCNICGKRFLLKSFLTIHIRKTHLMEKNVHCTECSYRFFSKKALRDHMLKHSGVKQYSCEVCHKSYARRYTLREHMRTHNNDRRFKCEVCEMTFVQKCTLKNHLLSNHDISMAASDIASS